MRKQTIRDKSGFLADATKILHSLFEEPTRVQPTQPASDFMFFEVLEEQKKDCSTNLSLNFANSLARRVIVRNTVDESIRTSVKRKTISQERTWRVDTYCES